jgi:hypothetical protein
MNKKIVLAIIPMLLLITTALACVDLQPKCGSNNGHDFGTCNIGYACVCHNENKFGCNNYKCDKICTESWQCSDWSSCHDGLQTRTCVDSNHCGTTESKPATTKGCSVCTPNWVTGIWSVCIDGHQTRTVTDTHECGTNSGKPSTTQTCTIQTCTPDWQIGQWSSCIDGLQTRVITDVNICGIQNTQSTQQECSVQCVPVKVYGEWGTCTDNIQSRSWSDNCGGSGTETQACSSTNENEVTDGSTGNEVSSILVSSGGLIPKVGEICAMNTFVPKNNLPKKVFTSCWNTTTDVERMDWIHEKYGQYHVISSVTVWKFTWIWWSL